jgi:hypothetical protein
VENFGINESAARNSKACRPPLYPRQSLGGRGRQPRPSRACRAARKRVKSSPAWYEERVSGEEETIEKPLAKAMVS